MPSFHVKRFKNEMPLELTVVHIHHGIRGDSADADERYVKALCRQLGVRYLAFHENVEQYAKEQGLTLEEAGRNIRRQIFEKVCKEKNGTKIALAHHQNDNAETLLWNLSRGCGLRGLGGISPAEGDTVRYIRPLLCVQRCEIEAFLQEKGISYCTDETNLEDHYTRNRIRNHVIPYLEQEVNPQAVMHMSETMEQMRAVWAFMEQEVQKCRERYVEKRPCGSAEDLYEERENVPELLIKEELFRDVDKTVRSFLIHALLLLCLTAQPEIGAAQLSAVGRFLLPAFQRGRTAQPHPMAVEELFQHDGLTGRLAAHRVEQGVFVFCKQILQHELFSVQERQDRSIRQRLAPHLFPAYHLVNLLCAGRRVWAAAGLRTNSSEKWKFLLKFLPKICADWRMDFPSRVVYNGDRT